MDKETLSNYGWIVICVLVLAVMLAFASPFGQFIADAVWSTTNGLFDTGDSELDTGLSAVGVSNKLPCGHGRKESGDHSQKGCGHYNCQDDCGCVPASCGVEGHWSGDGMDHATVVNHTGHTYACQCSGWVVPEGGTYKLSNGTVYNSGEQLPCNHDIRSTDVFTYGDYKYSYNGGWEVSLNLDVTDKNQETYGPILDEINGKYVTNMYQTFYNCSNLTTAPTIPGHVRNMHATFYNCTSLTTAPIIPESVTSLYHTFRNCSSLKTYVGNTDPDGDFSNYEIPNKVSNMAYTFAGCTSLVIAPDMSDATSITIIDAAFYGCTSLTGVPILSNCSKLTEMRQVFWNCTSLKDAGSLSIPNTVTKMSQAFLNCSALTVAPAIPSSVTDMNATFSGCSELAIAPDMSNATGVTNMPQTFRSCSKLSVAPDLSNCINLENVESTFWCCYALNDTIKLPCTLINASKGWTDCKATIEYVCTLDSSTVTDTANHTHE